MPAHRWTLWSGRLTLTAMHQAHRPLRFLALRILALTAAYLVALQALLLPLTVAAGAAYDPSICVTVQAPDDAPAPSRHDTGCACAAGCGMQCSASMLGGSPPFLVARAATYGLVFAPAPAIEPVARPFDKSPQNPRAPPAA